jgi:hypothetical protein
MSPNTDSSIEVKRRLKRAKTAIISGDRRASLDSIIASDRAAFSGCRILFASDYAGIPLQEMFSSQATATRLANIFCGTSVLAFSDQIEQEMLEERCEVRTVTPVVLDTNFASDLRRYVSGEDFGKREEF